MPVLNKPQRIARVNSRREAIEWLHGSGLMTDQEFDKASESLVEHLRAIHESEETFTMAAVERVISSYQEKNCPVHILTDNGTYVLIGAWFQDGALTFDTRRA